MKKVKVNVEVMNFQVRAYYSQINNIVISPNESQRVSMMESGEIDIKKLNDYLKTRKDIFSILSKKEKEKLEKIAEPIGTSGWRGTFEVEIDESKLNIRICDFCKIESRNPIQCGRCKQYHCERCGNGNPNDYESCLCREN